MNNKQNMNIKIMLLRILIVFFIVLSWEAGARAGMIDKFFFSSPYDIAMDLYKLFSTGKIFTHMLMTMKEVLSGLLLGVLSGVIIGIILGEFETIARVIDPLLIGLYAIPKIAIAPLFILWFGLGITAKIVFVWIVVFFLIFFNTYAGMKSVDPDLLDSVRAMGANRWQILSKVSIPSCIPWILVGLRASLASSLVAAIVGEFVAVDTGLGVLIVEGSNLFMTKRVFSVVLLLSIISMLMDFGLRVLEKYFLKWRPGREMSR